MANSVRRYWQTTNGDIYADGDWGNDKNDGTMAHPVKTFAGIRRLLPDDTSRKTVVMRGDFYLDGSFIDGHCTTFKGDYYGAARIHGSGEHLLEWCESYPNLMLIDMGNHYGQQYFRADSVISYWNSYSPLAGVGRASNAHVGIAGNVDGLASSPVLCHNSIHWRGAIGGNISLNSVIFSKPLKSQSCFAHLKGERNSCTHYDALYADGQIRAFSSASDGSTNPTSNKCLFAKWSIFVNGTISTFNSCFFTNDCNFYWCSAPNNDNPTCYIIAVGDDEDPERQEGQMYRLAVVEGVNTCLVYEVTSLEEAVRYMASITTGNGKTTFDENCVFSTTESSTDVFNDAEHLDFTIKATSSAYNNGNYFGGLPPALHIPVYKNSDGRIECFDHRTISGDTLSINDDNELCIDTTKTSPASILSKIIRIDPTILQFDGLYSYVQSKIPKGYVLADQDLYPYAGDFYLPSTLGNYVLPSEDGGTTGLNLTAGSTYVVTHTTATIKYNGIIYTQNQSFTVPADGPLYYMSDVTISTSSEQVKEIKIPQGGLLEAGTYVVTDASVTIDYNGNPYVQNSVFEVGDTDPKYYLSGDTSKQYQLRRVLLDYQYNVFYCRCRNLIYARAKQTDKLIQDVTYYNDSADKYVVLNLAARTINPGESFVNYLANETYTVVDSHGDPVLDYELPIMFDDRTQEQINNSGVGRLVPAATQWIPARLWGDYFVSKKNGSITTFEGIPEASGNARSWSSSSKSISGQATIINQPYVQFKIVVSCLSHHN